MILLAGQQPLLLLKRWVCDNFSLFILMLLVIDSVLIDICCLLSLFTSFFCKYYCFFRILKNLHFSYSPQRRCNLRKRRQRLLVVDGRWFVQLAMPNPLRRYQLCRFHPRTSKSARKNNFFTKRPYHTQSPSSHQIDRFGL